MTHKMKLKEVVEQNKLKIGILVIFGVNVGSGGE